MDADRFDMLLRTLARSSPRRSIAGALASLLLAGKFNGHQYLAASANKKKKRKKKKKKDKDKDKNDCDPRCSGGTLCCNGRCVSVLTDRENCGECGKACGVSEICRNAQCAPCDDPFALCTVAGTQQCVNVKTDRNHCGSCGTICPKDPTTPARDLVCEGGQCVCTGNTCNNGRCCPLNFAVCVGDGGACCPTDFPVPCNNGICCPAGFSCGGSCGQNCCQ